MLTDDTVRPAAPEAIDLAAVRDSLEKELRRREEIVSDLAPRATPNVDPVAYMTTVSTTRVIEQIRAALDRVSKGTYGRCARCDGGIAAGRLEVLPYAETCIACQSDMEGS